MRCEHCGTDYTDPSGYGDITEGNCHECGMPYRTQPNPLHSEMEMRNMPAPGEEDTGGNPLREGILADGGWGPTGTSQGTGRDESYASVRSPIQDEIIARSEVEVPWHMAAEFDIEQVVEPGPHTVEVDAPGQPLILQHDDPAILDAAKKQITGSVHEAAGVWGDIWNGIKNYALPAAEGLGGAALMATGVGAPEGAALEGAALEGAGAGGLLSAAKSAIPGLMKNLGVGAVRSLGGQAMNGLTGGGAMMSTVPMMDPAGMAAQPRLIQQLTHIVNGTYGDDFESPSSQSHIPANDTEDPEQVDAHEKNDGDNDTWQKDFSVNGIGGGQSPFGDDSHAVRQFLMMLPLVLHHTENGTGADDPLMHALDQMLEDEVPGYKDLPEDHGAIQILMSLKDGDKRDEGAPKVKEEAGDNGQEDSLDDNDIEKESSITDGIIHGPLYPEEQALDTHNWDNEGPQECPNCGAFTKMQLGGCPHCGATIQETPPRRLASGPRTPEQFKAVADLLRSTGREDEVQNMIDNPDQYEQELAEVQQRQEVTPADPTLPPTQAPMPGEQPIPPGAGMPMPPPQTGIQPMAADNVAKTCPNCGSHTTGLVDNDGTCRCHTCGKHFKMEDAIAADADSTHNTITARWSVVAEKGQEGNDHDHTNTIAVPAADQESPYDPESQQDSSLSWTDEGGNPLVVGQTYKMYSQKYDIPDVVKITAVKPGAIEYTIVGEYGLEHKTEVTHEESQLDGLSFVPYQGSDPEMNQTDPALSSPGIEENDSYPGQTGGTHDLSDSHEYALTAGVVRRAAQPAVSPPKDGVEHHDPALDWLRDERTAGAKFTLSEQREFIHEPGVARNADKLDLSNTHYESGYRDDDDFLFGLL